MYGNGLDILEKVMLKELLKNILQLILIIRLKNSLRKLPERVLKVYMEGKTKKQ